MAELNLKQIIDRLNAEFTGETRKLVFWYDDKADFAEDLENVELENAKIYRLQPDNQFYTKYFLERVDTTTNYLIYAPFPKPDVRDNHLEDTMLYSKRFFADRASLLSVDLGIEEKYKPMMNILDYLVGNTDRHWENWGLLVDNETNQPIRLHHLMDFNRAFQQYDILDGASCLTVGKRHLRQREAALEAVRNIDLNQLHNVDGTIFRGYKIRKDLFKIRLTILTSETSKMEI